MAELKAPGLTVAAFARKVGVHPQRLGSWRSRLGKLAAVRRMIERPEAAAVFIEVPHGNATSSFFASNSSTSRFVGISREGRAPLLR